MGLFGFIKKLGKVNQKDLLDEEESQIQEEGKAEQTKTEEPFATNIEKKKLLLNSKEDRSIFLKDNCEQILEATRQIEDAKCEYHAVTGYLTDMQKIERLQDEERQVLEDAARRIITLTRERRKYQQSEVKINDAQFRNIEKYEGEVIKSIKQMRENEDYNRIIKNDLRVLEKEKKSLLHQKKETIEKQKYLKNLSIITSVLVLLLFSLFLALSYAFEKEMKTPYLMTIAMAAISVAYIFYEARKNRYQMIVIERKSNKAIGLLNKVKIKFVNTTNALDYAYEKFNVKNADDLQYMWEQYLKAKEAAKRYQNNTDMLNRYNEILIGELKKLQVSDPDIWIYQSLAILDKREMVEIRHRLNIRRQKLRERIDYNAKLKSMGISEIKEILNNKPALRTEIIEVLKSFNLNIS